MNTHPALAVFLAVLVITAIECFPRGRILGGRESSGRPYVASVQVDGIHLCGALLISEEWLLSAAHCIPTGNHTLRVMMGSNSLKEPSKSKLEYNITTHFIHPLYNSSLSGHDIVLMKLPNKVPLSDVIKPLPYQTQDVDVAEGTSCLVAGWGHIKLTGKKTDTLQEVSVPVISREKCNRRDYYDNEITTAMMCAGEKSKDSCEGDSGGPLVCNGVAEGIVAGGSRKCGNMKRPGIYTRFAVYKDWIQNTIHNATLKATTAPPVLP
uniref:Peptidase S1 domain-containing protein n=1 Tax=Leptobrachium leishanense TaxID=445787 RepID=A0A8C5QTR2_9ANUR